MQSFDQHTAMLSLEKALSTNAPLVDSHSETDRLRMLVDFAALFNFYDRTNQINGNWAPFLLKDPVFLVASIAKTAFQKPYTLFVNTCLRLRQALQKNTTSNFITNGFNQVFDQLLRIFHVMERWTHYMQQATLSYNLKTYLIGQIQKTYSAILWAMLELRQVLFTQSNTSGANPIVPGITPVNTYGYQNYDQKIWKQSKDQQPYWVVLGLVKDASADFSINDLTAKQLFAALHTTGKKIFNFFQTNIAYAEVELVSISKQPDVFPDTLLLRAFTDLMKIYQQQLNTLTQKHLNFYYQDILRQSPQRTVADSVFITAETTKKTATFSVPKGTNFSAGIDQNKQPIVFETLSETSVNPAQIAKVITLTQIPDGYNSVLDLQEITNTEKVSYLPTGALKKWKLFGSQTVMPKQPQTMAIAFGSPMFYLEKAENRIITLNFTLTTSAYTAIIENKTQFYLSTAKAWFPIPKEQIVATFSTVDYRLPLTIDTKLTLVITLKASDPAIAAFTKNPDGYTSTWPLFKMEFTAFEQMASPPCISDMTINVQVTGVQNFKLYNDFGALDPTKPFQPLGPTPKVSQNFMIGNAELFSKPLQSMEITMTWNPFAKGFNFEHYYCQYNNYLSNAYENTPKTKDDQKDAICDLSVTPTAPTTALVKTKKSTFLGRLFHKHHTTETTAAAVTTTKKEVVEFCNSCFEVTFQFLENSNWKPMVDSSGNPEAAQTLFTANGTNTLEKERTFSFTKFNQTQTYVTPELQQQPLTFTEGSANGFLKMELTNPSKGFGTDLYAKVVSAIALYNAGIIAKKVNDSSSDLVVIQPPNVPFTPTVSIFSGTYVAETAYTFSENTNQYPLECFYTTPFESYKIFDNADRILDHETSLATPFQEVNAEGIDTKGKIPLTPQFSNKGQLFLGLTNCIAPAEINIYMELARTYTEAPITEKRVSYTYLSTSGWKPLEVVSDGTNGFLCSGIITFSVPSDIDMSATIMPSSYVWIAIGTTTNPDTFAQVTFLKTNGIELQRILTDVHSKITPELPAKSITKPVKTIPEITKILQPFASFGGKAAETKSHMNKRVSTRIRTKDRLVTAEDYFSVIRIQFPEIYYSKTKFCKQAKQVKNYVIKRVSNASEANAFEPLVSECKELALQNYLQQRASAFTVVNVQNFELRYIKITADIQIANTYDVNKTAAEINQAVNVFLSPWITSAQTQITIDKGIDTASIATFIKTFQSVISVNGISLQQGKKDAKTGVITYGKPTQEIIPERESILLVPSLNNISKNSTMHYHL